MRVKSILSWCEMLSPKKYIHVSGSIIGCIIYFFSMQILLIFFIIYSVNVLTRISIVFEIIVPFSNKMVWNSGGPPIKLLTTIVPKSYTNSSPAAQFNKKYFYVKCPTADEKRVAGLYSLTLRLFQKAQRVKSCNPYMVAGLYSFWENNRFLYRVRSCILYFVK